MARFNEILVGRFNRAVQKTFSMKGPASLATISDEALPVFMMDTFQSAELRFTSGWDIVSASHVFGAAAAQNQGLQVRNPVGSNVIAVVEKIVVSTTTAQELTVYNSRTNTADLATAFSAIVPDFRGRSQSSLIATFQVTTPSTVGFAAIWDQWCNANTPTDVILDINHELPFAPGQTVLVSTNTVNTTFAAEIRWRERFLEDSERT